MTSTIFDDRKCQLGEGALWHPGRAQFFWFDILGQKLLSRDGAATQGWDFDENVSAAGWVDDMHLLIASETALQLFDITSGESEFVTALESDTPGTRSNDGRADPYGGFWVGTMGKEAEPRAGAIYRYYRGELRQLFANVTIPNAICFSPDGGHAFYTDTADSRLMRQRLEPQHGWPIGEPELFLDACGETWGIDGAVVDAEGNLWNAQWGGWRVAAYSPAGALLQTVDFNAAQTSCPAFGGADLTTLFCTTAQQNLDPTDLDRSADHGKTFAAENIAKGQPEHPVIL